MTTRRRAPAGKPAGAGPADGPAPTPEPEQPAQVEQPDRDGDGPADDDSGPAAATSGDQEPATGSTPDGTAAAPLEPPVSPETPAVAPSLPPGAAGIAVADRAVSTFGGQTPTLYDDAGNEIQLDDVIRKAPPPGLTYYATQRVLARRPIPNTNIETTVVIVGEGQVFGPTEYDRLRNGLGLSPGPHAPAE